MSIAEAEAARDEALDRVERKSTVWTLSAAIVIIAIARAQDTLTADDVWEAMHDPRALGAAMRNAAKEKTIEATDRWVLSTRVACHRRPIRVWRSLVRKPSGASA